MKTPQLPSIAALMFAATLGGCCCSRMAPGPSSARDVRPTSGPGSISAVPAPCTAEWNRLVDERLAIADPSGHGPDIGSADWFHAVGRKSGVMDAAGHGPDPGSAEWCRAVDFKVFGRR